MKFTIGSFTALVISFALCVTSCKTSTTTEESTRADSTAVESHAPSPVTICMLPEVGIRETPGESGKYITTLYLSETITLTGDSATAEAGGKLYNYYKVQLEDGKQGWIRTDFIAKDVVPAVFTGVTPINKRPDLASVTDKNFSAMDFVATRPAKDNWIEVSGIPFGEKWFVRGYVHSDNLSYDPTDISFAALYKRAGSMKDLAKSKALMDQLSINKDFQSSRFYSQIFGGGEENVEGDEGDVSDNFAAIPLNKGYFQDDIRNITLDNLGKTTGAEDRYQQADRALHFDGMTALSGELFEDLVGVTYFLWVRSDKDQTATILALGNNCTSGYSILLDNSLITILCGGVATNVTNATYKLPPGEWVHIAIVKDQNSFSLYVNGELSSSGSSGHNSLTSLFTIGAGTGCEDEAIGNFFTGSIDDVRIQRRAYEAGEVREQYQQGAK